MTKFTISTLAMLIALMLVGPSQAKQVFFYEGTYQPDYGLDLNWLGGSARARAMGGAFIGVSDDASALTWNPAGLIHTLDPQVSLSGGYANPKSTFGLSSGEGDGNDYAMDKNVWGISHASFLAPIKMAEHEFSLSIAYQRLNDISSARFIDLYTIPTQSAYYEQTMTGNLDVINLGFGTFAYKDLAIGASANIYIGNAEELTQLYTRWEGTLFDDNGAPFQGELTTRAHILSEVDYSGFNLTFGLHYKTDKIGLGLVAKTPFDLAREFDITLADTTYLAKIGFIPRPINDEPLFIIGDRKEKLGIPLDLAAGVSYSLSPNLMVAADAEFRRFGRASISVLDSGVIRSSGEKDEYFTDTPLNFQNSGEARIGLEYKIESAGGIIPVRCGFRYVQHYLRDTDVDSLYKIWDEDNDGVSEVTYYEEAGDRITGYGLSAGTGLHWERIWLDLAFEYYTDNRTVHYTDLLENERKADDKYQQARVVLNFTGFF